MYTHFIYNIYYIHQQKQVIFIMTDDYKLIPQEQPKEICKSVVCCFEEKLVCDGHLVMVAALISSTVGSNTLVKPLVSLLHFFNNFCSCVLLPFPSTSSTSNLSAAFKAQNIFRSLTFRKWGKITGSVPHSALLLRHVRLVCQIVHFSIMQHNMHSKKSKFRSVNIHSILKCTR